EELLRGRRDFCYARQEWSRTVARDHRDRTNRGAHAPPPHHLTSNLGELLDVRLRPVARLAEDDFLGCTPAERDLDLCFHLRLAVVVTIAFGCSEGDAERDPARDDRDLADGIGALREHADDRVAGLVIGRTPPIL